MCGFWKKECWLTRTLKVETWARLLTASGGNHAGIEQGKRNDIKAFFELHIEQGPILEISVTTLDWLQQS